jgi:hypothetical protein
MTATEMYSQFLFEINQPNNFNVRSYHVGLLLSRASKELYNELYFNRYKNPPDPKAPTSYSYESEAYISDALHSFKKTITTNTDVLGFLANAGGLAHITAVLADKTNKPNCVNPEYVIVSYVSDNELSARLNDRLRKPTWNDADMPVVGRYMPVYHLETNKLGQLGIKIYPNLKYALRIDYVKFPSAIKIKSTTWESTLYAGNPQFISQLTDVNSEFPEFLHNEIVKRAVALFALENPDTQQFQAETAKVNSGQI